MTERRTLIDWAIHWEQTAPDRLYLTQPLGGGHDNVQTWTFREAVQEARRMAAYLQSLELPAGSHIALCSKNCAHWVMADLAIWMAGHVTVPLFPILTPDIVQYTLEHSEAKLLFVGKLDPIWDEMKRGVPAGLPCIAFPLAPPNDHEQWDSIVAAHEPLAEPAARAPEELATIIYTSGSTGRPKGVMITFGAMLFAAAGANEALDTRPDDRMLSYLPLSHVFDRWISECHSLRIGFPLWFAEEVNTFQQDLQRARPTLFPSVPRLWLKFQLGIFRKLPPKKLDRLLRIPILRGVIKKKILTQLGLEHARFAGSGSAPAPAELLTWYRGLGLELLEGYAMSENFGYSHVARPGEVRPGYVGTPLPGVEHRIGEDSEIQIKSPTNMLGYYKLEEETQATFTADGWLKTGDQGEIDAQDRLKITGRIKEIFKTSKGKYVVPAPIENAVVNHPRIEMCCVSGSGQPRAHAMIQLSEEAGEMLEQGGQAQLEEELTAHLTQVNAGLAHHERLQFLVVIKDEWLPENGFLTPTLKVKRPVLEKTYGPLADAWYATKQAIVWQ